MSDTSVTDNDIDAGLQRFSSMPVTQSVDAACYTATNVLNPFYVNRWFIRHGCPIQTIIQYMVQNSKFDFEKH